MKTTTRIFSALAIAGVPATGASAATQFDQDVTPDVIFGTGNDNGAFTTDRANGVELGLRGKLRHNATGSPENTFNSQGNGTYVFQPGVAPAESFPTAEWSFEWSINSDFDGSSGWNLEELTYELSMDSPDTGTSIPTFDPINDVNGDTGTVQWDHAIGDNSTGNGGGTSISNNDSDASGYATRIADNNVAQNSWKPHWFVSGFDPNAPGDYIFTLEAFDGSTSVAKTEATISVVPSPTAALGALSIAGLGLLRRRRA